MIYKQFKALNVMLTLTVFCLTLGAEVDSGLQKITNHTLNLPPEPPLFDFRIEPLFEELRFDYPVDIVSVPGDRDRLFVVEITGKIIVVTGLNDQPRASIFLDLSDRIVRKEEAGLLGLTFHPNHLENGRLFVFYSLETITSAGAGLHQKVSEFRVRPGEPNIAVKEIEINLITQYDESVIHNGGDLEFGPDAYLYISVGDEGLGK
ncbi:MAG TPA: hypothetical protein EYQ50_21035 [Verrucomicrobiales bacterium]|nr:hypothetical protein [Verrucomicrobiales bacterium]